MEPVAAPIALDVEHVGVQRFLADAVLVPGGEARIQGLFDGVVGCAAEEDRLANVLQLVVLLDLVHLALRHDAVYINLIHVISGEHLVVSNVLLVRGGNAQLLKIKVSLSIEPLDLNHGPLWVVMVRSLMQNSLQLTHNFRVLRFSQEQHIPNFIDAVLELNFLIDFVLS